MFGLFEIKTREAKVASFTLGVFQKITDGLDPFTEEEQFKIVTELRAMVLQDIHNKREDLKSEVERLNQIIPDL